ncbi:class I SAM-dependent methyltransferase [Psychroserpens luteus]|uniref:Class I SAM-dependent methyltransferase n=1 Tax=Psychroserpens luteus TaxID=1434066 RepID=A0ABW6A129_9FLAO|nr:class I SAM-dependent methyltransferase [Psychroserpens luteus]
MTKLESTLQPIRKELIGDLEGSILEVGSGTGTNFKHYNAKAKVIALEPSSFMLDKSKAKLPKKTQITTYNMGIGDKRLDSIIKNNSLDYIICTLVLCTIPDQNLALDKFKKWLKPTGKLIVLEHIHAQNKPNRLLYNMVNPLWKIVGDGCNLNRDTDLSIKKAGFKVESEHYFKKALGFYQAVFTVSSSK